MNRIKDALSQFLQAGMKVDEVRRMYAAVGLNADPLFEVYSFIYDGMCALTGEVGDEEFDYGNTSVSLALSESRLPVQERVRIMMDTYLKNRSLEVFDEQIADLPEQPKPHIIDEEEMRKQAEKGCGYIAPDGSLL